MQCGVACLASLCTHYRKKYSTQFLSNYCIGTSTGVSLKSLSVAAERLGFDTMCVRFPKTSLRECHLPCILHWNQNHYVILYKIDSKRKRYYICDPAKGLLKMNESEFDSHWMGHNDLGIALLLEPSPSFGLIDEKNTGNGYSIKLIIDYLKEYKKYLFQVLLGLLVGCILQLLLPFLTQSIVDVGINNKDLNFIWLVLLGELLIIIGKAATDFIRRWLLLHISVRVNISLVSDFFIKLLKLPMPFFESKHLGDLTQRVGDHNRVQSFLTNQTLSVAFALLSFLVLGVVLFTYNDAIFGIFILGSIAYTLWIALFLHKRKIIDYELFEQESINQSKTYQFLTSIQEIKLQNCENRRRWEWEDTQADLFRVKVKSLKLQQLQEAGSLLVNEIKNILVTAFSATAVINGDITLGSMLAIQYIVGQLNSPIEQLMNFIYSFQDMRISMERINEIHNDVNEDTEIRTKEMKLGNDKSILFKNVDFKYEPCSMKKTLDDITIKIPEKKVTAIVGASGSGKTTFIKLMLGYYKLLGGEITIAENNINSYNLKWWRSQCGVVMQDGYIFSESIARNIAVDDNEIDILRLETAAKIANIWDYIQSLPLKYDTKIGQEGTGLSQGQKQRILIARAVYKNPLYIFLDEATNALDAKNERVIVENLAQFYKGRTVVIVAHRLSTVKDADQIIVLDGGRVVEIGNHASLTAAQGTYYNLVKNQLELGN